MILGIPDSAPKSDAESVVGEVTPSRRSGASVSVSKLRQTATRAPFGQIFGVSLRAPREKARRPLAIVRQSIWCLADWGPADKGRALPAVSNPAMVRFIISSPSFAIRPFGPTAHTSSPSIFVLNALKAPLSKVVQFSSTPISDPDVPVASHTYFESAATEQRSEIPPAPSPGSSTCARCRSLLRCCSQFPYLSHNHRPQPRRRGRWRR